MPTSNPRVNVTLSPSTDALVQRLAGLQRVSKAQVLRELLEAAEPALQRAAALMEAASQARGAVLDGMARQLDQHEARFQKATGKVLSDFDAMTDDLVAQAEAVRGRRPRSARQRGPGPSPAPARPKDPPASNRGVKSPKRGGRRSGSGGRA